jgi:hypothetical protein
MAAASTRRNLILGPWTLFSLLAVEILSQIAGLELDLQFKDLRVLSVKCRC